MRKMIAVAFASATLLLLVPSMAAGAFYGTPTGKAKKEPGRRRHVDHVQADLPAALEQIAARYNEGAGAVRRSSVTP